MGNAQRFTKSSLGLLFSRSGVKQGNLDRTRSAKKCRKKDLTLSVGWTMQGLFFTFERLSEDATFCPNQDARRCPKTYYDLARLLYQDQKTLATGELNNIC